MNQPLSYDPSIFEVRTFDEAKRIILTTEGALTTNERWRKETPYLLDLIQQHTQIDHDSIVLDYGCGIGRMSRGLIERFGCRVVGVDISPSMRALAHSYVSSSRFVVCAPEAMDWIGVGLSGFDLALSVWVLQHCHDVERDIDRITQALRSKGKLFLVNDYNRIVPTTNGWATDGKSVPGLLDHAGFTIDMTHPLDPEQVGKVIADASYWSIWRR